MGIVEKHIKCYRFLKCILVTGSLSIPGKLRDDDAQYVMGMQMWPHPKDASCTHHVYRTQGFRCSDGGDSRFLQYSDFSMHIAHIIIIYVISPIQ